jgi:transcription elongation factor GreA
MEQNPVTPEGYVALEEELRHAKSVERPAVVRDIEEARAHGDISENSEYEDAKERQSLLEGRIRRLEHMLAAAQVIDVAKLPVSERVVFGTTVVIENTETSEQRTWRIVGEHEADVAAGKISYKAPVAKAVIGRSAGDEVVIPTPGGQQRWEILEVRYG